MYNIIKKLKNRSLCIKGVHPTGEEYNHGRGEITDIWEVNGCIGFRFYSFNSSSGYTWPGIETINKISDNQYKFEYSNVYNEIGYCIVDE